MEIVLIPVIYIKSYHFHFTGGSVAEWIRVLVL